MHLFVSSGFTLQLNSYIWKQEIRLWELPFVGGLFTLAQKCRFSLVEGDATRVVWGLRAAISWQPVYINAAMPIPFGSKLCYWHCYKCMKASGCKQRVYRLKLWSSVSWRGKLLDLQSCRMYPLPSIVNLSQPHRCIYFRRWWIWTT